VQREMREETGLEVQVDSLLLDEPSTPGAIYQRWKTYRCSILTGEACPGSEPEAIYANAYSFTEVGWFDLRDPATWNTRLDLFPTSIPGSNGFRKRLAMNSHPVVKTVKYCPSSKACLSREANRVCPDNAAAGKLSCAIRAHVGSWRWARTLHDLACRAWLPGRAG
jgi:hypothetical protein